MWSFPGVSKNHPNLAVWGVNLKSIDAEWEKSVLSYMYDRNTSYPSVDNVISLPQSEELGLDRNNISTYGEITNLSGSIGSFR